MGEIKICLYRTYTEVKPTILKGQGDVKIQYYPMCERKLKNDK